MHVTVASVSSHLAVRTRHFLEIKEKKYKRNINNDLAVVASYIPVGVFMAMKQISNICHEPLSCQLSPSWNKANCSLLVIDKENSLESSLHWSTYLYIIYLVYALNIPHSQPNHV